MIKHKQLLRLTLILAGAGMGAMLGLALRAHFHLTTATSSLSTVTKQPAAEAIRPGSTNLAPLPEKPILAGQLQQALTISSGVTQWLCWMATVEKAAPSDFPRLATLARGNRQATRFLAARWAELAPRHLFDTLVTASSSSGLPIQELASALFSQWAKSDPQAAIDALNQPGTLGRRAQWRMQVVNTILEQDVELGLRLMADWHIENYGPNMRSINAWAKADPRHAAEFILDHPSGYVSQMSIEAAGHAWAQSDPAAALAFAAGQPGNLGSSLATVVLKDWANRNLSEATQWLDGIDAKTRDRLSPAFLEAWAKQDAAAALAWSQENLSGSRLNRAVASLIRGASEKDIPAAAAMVMTMEPSSARADAAAIVARKWFPEFSSDQKAKPESITWLGQLDPESTRRALEEITWQWSTSDLTSMAAFVSSLPDNQVPFNADSVLARQMARKDPAGALDWAAQLPGNRSLRAGGEAFAEWRMTQPETAMQWLQQLQSEDPRKDPFFQNAIRALAYDPQTSQQLTALSESDRSAARKVIASMSLPDDRRAQLLDLLKNH